MKPMIYNFTDDLMMAKKILNRLLVDPIFFAFAKDSLTHPSEGGWDTGNLYLTIEAARAHLERATGDETRPDDIQHLEAEVPYYLPTEETDWR